MSSAPSNPEPGGQGAAGGSDQALQRSSGAQGPSTGVADLEALIRRLGEVGGVPIMLTPALPRVIDTGDRLSKRKPVTVAFPPCSDVLLALIRTTDVPAGSKDDVTRYFDEYFKFGHHHVIIEGDLRPHLDRALLDCLPGDVILASHPAGQIRQAGTGEAWPADCCFCSPCLTLDGNRNKLPPLLPNQQTDTGATTVAEPHIRRLFLGDMVFFFFWEKMGLFQILGAILDAYASNGRLPISNGSVDVGGPTDLRDDVVALVLEAMVRQTKMGMSSTVRDRGCSYRTALGWVSDAARKLGLDTQVNTGFNTQFHKFIGLTHGYYRNKEMAVAIRGSVAPAPPPSVATLITIRDTLDVLKKQFEAFDYGRNYYNTLAGIVWTISAMSVIRELRTTLGVPPAFNDPYEYIPAAYDLLVLKKPVTGGDANRYLLHKQCAVSARDILLDMEVVDHSADKPGGELELWLTQIESKVEAYRTAYRTLTGTDLGATGTPVIEQQA